jgi:hypothetical protein
VRDALFEFTSLAPLSTAGLFFGRRRRFATGRNLARPMMYGRAD